MNNTEIQTIAQKVSQAIDPSLVNRNITVSNDEKINKAVRIIGRLISILHETRRIDERDIDDILRGI